MVPKLIVSDNAKAFKSEVTKKFMRDRGVSWKFNLPQAPWTGKYKEMFKKSIALLVFEL